MAHAAVFDHHPPPLARATIDYHQHHGHQQHPPPPPPASSSSALDSYAHHISIVPGPAPTPGPSAARKRKLSPGPEMLNEARRLRRSHEACVRCRSKKIKVCICIVTCSLWPVCLTASLVNSATRTILAAEVVCRPILSAIKRTGTDTPRRRAATRSNWRLDWQSVQTCSQSSYPAFRSRVSTCMQRDMACSRTELSYSARPVS